MQRAQLLRQLVRDSQYVIDEHQVANAILARAAARRLVGETAFRNDARAARTARVRSFRPSAHVRSFRPCVLGGPLERRHVGVHLGLM
jgi:hypothetical protein